MLTEAQMKFIARRLNEKINVPLIGENAEFKLLMMAVRKINRVLEQELPEELIEFLTDLAKGFEPEDDLEEIKRNTVVFLNKEVNLPIIGEDKEEKLITEVVDLLFNAMRKHRKLEEAA
jgi:hypothetical protein